MIYIYQNHIELYVVESCFCTPCVIGQTLTSLQNRTFIFIIVLLLSSFQKHHRKIKRCTFFKYTTRSKSQCAVKCTVRNTSHTKLIQIVHDRQDLFFTSCMLSALWCCITTLCQFPQALHCYVTTVVAINFATPCIIQSQSCVITFMQ